MNKITQHHLTVSTAPSSQRRTLTYFQVQGMPGKHVHIQASVHGSELQGNLVIYHLLEYLKKWPLNGSITLVPLANTQATDNKISTFTQGRFHPQNGENWNRLYFDLTPLIKQQELEKLCESSGTSEIKNKYKDLLQEKLDRLYKEKKEYGISDQKLLAYQLQKLSLNADIVLDLHTGPVATNYLYALEDKKELAQDLNFPHIIYIPNEFAGAMDEASFVPWNKLENYCKENNISYTPTAPFEAYTLELGSEEFINTNEALKQCENILNFLHERQMLPEYTQSPDNFVHHQKVYSAKLEHFVSYYAVSGGLIEYCKKPGEQVKKDETLYRILTLDKKGFEQQEIAANKDGVVINHAPSSALAQGNCVYQILELTV